MHFIFNKLKLLKKRLKFVGSKSCGGKNFTEKKQTEKKEI